MKILQNKACVFLNLEAETKKKNPRLLAAKYIKCTRLKPTLVFDFFSPFFPPTPPLRDVLCLLVYRNVFVQSYCFGPH